MHNHLDAKKVQKFVMQGSLERQPIKVTAHSVSFSGALASDLTEDWSLSIIYNFSIIQKKYLSFWSFAVILFPDSA